MNTICRECETVAHCTKHGCIPKVRDTIDMMRDACDKDKVDAWQNGFWTITQEELKAFEAIVRADERERLAKIQFESILQAMKIEREACAKICDFHCADYTKEGAEVCAEAIRARGQRSDEDSKRGETK